MKTSTHSTSHHKANGHDKAHINEALCELLNEGKKRANELYSDGTKKIESAEESIKEYSDSLLKKVQENPLASVLIAGGIGFILSRLLKK